MSKDMRFIVPILPLGYVTSVSVPASRKIINAPSAASDGRPDDVCHSSHEYYACPKCSGLVIRQRRRFMDRLVSLITPVRRYRCLSKGWGCDWEGNLRVRSDMPD